MVHVKYNDKGNITWISPDMDWQYRRGNVSPELWEAINKFLNTKKGNK